MLNSRNFLSSVIYSFYISPKKEFLCNTVIANILVVPFDIYNIIFYDCGFDILLYHVIYIQLFCSPSNQIKRTKQTSFD